MTYSRVYKCNKTILQVVELLVSHWEVRENWGTFPGFFYMATQVGLDQPVHH